jgi:hypothetical protein
MGLEDSTIRIVTQERQRLVRDELRLVLDRPGPSLETARVIYLDEHRSVRPARKAEVLEMFGAQVICMHRKSNPRDFTPSVA